MQPVKWLIEEIPASSGTSHGLPLYNVDDDDDLRYHCYISHSESSKHKARMLQLNLQELLPGLRAYIDDTSGSRDEASAVEHIRHKIKQSKVFLVYLTEDYFAGEKVTTVPRAHDSLS